MKIELILTRNEVLRIRRILMQTEEDAEILTSSNLISQSDRKFYQEEFECCKKVGKMLDLALDTI